MTIDQEKMRELHAQAEAHRLAEPETSASTKPTLQSKTPISDKPAFRCLTCLEELPYSVKTMGQGRFKAHFQERGSCACERAAAEIDRRKREEQRKQAEAAEAQYRMKTMHHAARLDRKLARYTFESLRQHPGFKSAMANGLKQAYDYCLAYAEGWNIETTRRGIILSSAQCGDFKTGLLCCVANHLLTLSVRLEFWPVCQLLNSIRRSYGPDTSSTDRDLVNHLSELPVLILDDLGAERIRADERGDWAREQLYDIIDPRDGRELPTLVTTNCSVAELEERLHSRTVSRLMGMCKWIDIPLQKDYRL